MLVGQLSTVWHSLTHRQGAHVSWFRSHLISSAITSLRRGGADLQVWGGSAAFLAFNGRHSRSRQDVAPLDNTWR